VAALARERVAVASARPGERNATLNRAAFNLGQLVAAGLLDHERVRGVLLAAALEAGNPRPKRWRRSPRGCGVGRPSPAGGTVLHDLPELLPRHRPRQRVAARAS
jgi:hypothetical protein